VKLIGITSSLDDKKIFLRREYISKIVSFGYLPLIISSEMINFQREITNEISALIISGGGDINPCFYGEENTASYNIVPDERVLAEMELLRIFISTNKPVLGICYGMQLINIFLKGSLYQNIETSLNHKEGLHKIEIFDDFPLQKGIFTVNSSHHQAVKRLGEGLKPFCKSEDGIIEGIYLKHHPFFVGVQWHPERDSSEVSNLLWQNFIKRIK